MAKVLNYHETKVLFEKAKAGNFAMPAINISSSNTINAGLEAAAEVRSPIIIQFSNKGSHFFAGLSLPNDSQQASIAGAVSSAKYVHEVVEQYNVPVILNTDHAAKKLLPWVDGMLKEGEKFYELTGRPLFSSHMIDLSEESITENIEICKRYLERMTKLDMFLEIELGVTGGEEDGVDNTEVENSKLYTQPEEVGYAYEELRKVSENFVIAASFGNVHGVYKPGNVQLEPVILKKSQDFIREKFSTGSNPVNFVFHGGSGSSQEQITEAIQYGVIKMNVDTDLQWAFWEGVRDYAASNHEFLQTQLGNSTDPDSPNKKYYDPRVWLRKGEIALKNRIIQAFRELNCIGVLN